MSGSGSYFARETDAIFSYFFRSVIECILLTLREETAKKKQMLIQVGKCRIKELYPFLNISIQIFDEFCF